MSLLQNIFHEGFCFPPSCCLVADCCLRSSLLIFFADFFAYVRPVFSATKLGTWVYQIFASLLMNSVNSRKSVMALPTFLKPTASIALLFQISINMLLNSPRQEWQEWQEWQEYQSERYSSWIAILYHPGLNMISTTDRDNNEKIEIIMAGWWCFPGSKERPNNNSSLWFGLWLRDHLDLMPVGWS